MHEIISDMPFMYGRVAVVVRVALSFVSVCCARLNRVLIVVAV